MDRETGGMRARYSSPRGPVEAEWHFERKYVRYRASIPVGAEGRLILPCDKNDIRVVRGEEGIAACHSAGGRLLTQLQGPARATAAPISPECRIYIF